MFLALARSVQSSKSCPFTMERNSSDLNANLTTEIGKQLDMDQKIEAISG